MRELQGEKDALVTHVAVAGEVLQVDIGTTSAYRSQVDRITSMGTYA